MSYGAYLAYPLYRNTLGRHAGVRVYHVNGRVLSHFGDRHVSLPLSNKGIQPEYCPEMILFLSGTPVTQVTVCFSISAMAYWVPV